FLARPTPGALIWLILWGLLAIALVLTFNRSFWAATALALVMSVLLARGQERTKTALWILGLGFLLVVVLLLVFYEPDSEAARLASATLDRLTTMVSRETFEDPFESSLRWRDFEYTYAIPQILARPITGIGLGTFYRPYLYGIDWVGFDGRAYTHNGHLAILMTTGLLGYLPFLWLSFVFLKRGFQYWHRVSDPLLRATMLAFTLTYLGLFFISIVSSIFMDWFWMPVIGLMMGTNEAIIRTQVLQPVHRGGPSIGR
ncbi:MAG: O-antigen ligase family protein, partial [Chloroflexi bacterium]|nr:O-antigen ligase family protein [Chloroflexota bacterium]